jgi:GDP-4-dehydro-6-deoxy-D-mannose reductase
VLRTGNLTVRRDFLHVDDVVRAYLAAALRGRTGEAYNVCSGVSWRLGQVLDRMRALSGVEVDLEQDPALYRPADIPELRGNAEKLRADTGWEPTVSFDTLLTELLDHWHGRVGEGR